MLKPLVLAVAKNRLISKMASAVDASMQYRKICQKVIPGVLNHQNRGVQDWGWQGLLAYGCRSGVVIVDTLNVQIIQTLYEHPGNVVKVKWAKNWSCRPLRIASADTLGNIIVWDVALGKQIHTLTDGTRPVAEMEWLSSTENSYDMLAALHPPYSLIIWNTQAGTKLWKKSYTETLLSFTFDPFCNSNMAFLSQDCILLVEDFTLNKVPSSNGRKFFVSSPNNAATSNLSSSNATSHHSEEKTSSSTTRHKLKRRVRLLVGADTKTSRSDETNHSGECLALTYHPAFRHHLLLVYSREVLVIDLEINQTVGILTAERNSSPFVQVVPCHQRDAICCLHDNGMLSLHVRRNCTSDSSEMELTESYLEVTYDTVAQSDPVRLTKLHRVLGVSVCPQTEVNFALLVSDGRLHFLDLQFRQPSLHNTSCMDTLGDLEPPLYGSLDDVILTPSQYKFVLTGVLQSAAAPPLVVRMCPPLTLKNWNVYEPLLAAGSTMGLIQIFDMSSGMLYKELTVHTYPVRGIEWVSLSAVLSFAHQNLSNSSGQVKNELFLTDIPTGKSRMLRIEKLEESPIEMLRVSSFKQYFIVAFKDDPFELWDLRTLTLLRSMPKRFPVITALEWMPTRNSKNPKRMSLVDGGGGALHSHSFSIDSKQSNVNVKELFTFVDTDGQLYQFNVEGNLIKEGAKLPPESGMGSITTLAWKGEFMAMGDVDGNLNLWDLRSKVSQSIPTHRGWIKRVRFAPGRGNMKVLVLYGDGVDIWDIVEAKLYGQVRCPKDLSRVEDADWAASDRPVLVTDGCIRVMNIGLQKTSPEIHDWASLVDVWCPVLLPQSLNAFTTLLHLKLFTSEPAVLKHTGDVSSTGQVEFFNSYYSSLDQNLSENCKNCPLKLVHHCVMISRLFGYESEVQFWSVALKYLRAELKRRSVKTDSRCHQCRTSQLDARYDLLCDVDTYKRVQLDQLALHESKRTTHEHSRKCSETLLLFRETDRAVRQLLETDPSAENFYVDCLRACIVASVQSSHASQSTIKLVATNLIANGHISEGVQLLCLIGKGLDACRYLQSYGHWERSMWLAKCTLTETECLEVAKRWSDHLASTQTDQPKKAILVLLSVHQFLKVIEMLMNCGFVESAAIFAKICDELGVLDKTDATSQMLKELYAKYEQYRS